MRPRRSRSVQQQNPAHLSVVWIFQILADAFSARPFDSRIALSKLRCSNLADLNSSTKSPVWRNVVIKAAILASRFALSAPNCCRLVLLICTQRSISSESAMTGLRRLLETRFTGRPSRSHRRALLGVRCKHSAISFHPLRILIVPPHAIGRPRKLSLLVRLPASEDWLPSQAK